MAHKANDSIGVGDNVGATVQRNLEAGIKLKGYLSGVITRADGTKEVVADREPNLITTQGFEFIARNLYETLGLGSGDLNTNNRAIYVGLSNNQSNTVAGDRSMTKLEGEFGTGSGFMDIRRKVVESSDYSAVTVDGTTTRKQILKASFTASQDRENIHKSGLYTDLTGNTLIHIADFNANFSIGQNDSVEVTWEITVDESA